MKPVTANQLIGEQPPSPPAAEYFITTEEVARRLHKTPRTVQSYLRLGLIPYVKIGRSVLMSWPQVEAAIRERFTVNGGAK